MSKSKKTVNFWIAKQLSTSTETRKSTLRGLCDELRWSYSTAKSKVDQDGGVIEVVIDNKAYSIWKETVS